MRKVYIYGGLFLLLILLLYGKDCLFSWWSTEDEMLSKTIVLKSDYEMLEQNYEALLVENELWKTYESEFITSKVVVRDAYTFFDEVTILKGKEDGVEVGDIVINHDGYIGMVKSMADHSSQVELFTNKNTKLSVRVRNSYGMLVVKQDKLIIDSMTSKEVIEVGDEVYTSGYTNVPGDILVGKVSRVVPTNLGQELEIESSVNFQEFWYVTVRHQMRMP